MGFVGSGQAHCDTQSKTGLIDLRIRGGESAVFYCLSFIIYVE